MVKVSWRINFSASAIHAAYQIVSNEADALPASVGPLKASAQALNAIIVEFLEARSMMGWKLLIGMSSAIESNSDLASQWLRRVRQHGASNQSNIVRLAGAISDVEAAMRAAFPKVMEQLELRRRPLEEQWLGYGRGLTAHLRRLTEPEWLVDEAEGIFVQPILGGAGIAHPLLNRFSIEAVITNPLAELPEVVRIAWLVAQLQADLPKYSDELGPDRAPAISALASLAATLAAAEVLELGRCDETNLQLAIEHWQVAVPRANDVPSLLIAWWETHLQTRPPWNIALKALDKMMAA
jgi:hypothetical protein